MHRSKTYNAFSEPSAGLFVRIMARIAAEQRAVSAKRKAAFCAALFVVSAFALVVSFGALRAEFVASGFGSLVSLLFSDPGVVATIFGDFAFSLLESLPVSALFVFAALLVVFLGSLQSFARQLSLSRVKLITKHGF